MKNLAILVLALLPAACTAEMKPEEQAVAPNTETVDATMAKTVEQGEHTVSCGCKLESIGACGNYVDVDGAWLEIADHASHGLGAMEWCSVPEAKAEVAGSVEDGKFVATFLKVIG